MVLVSRIAYNRKHLCLKSVPFLFLLSLTLCFSAGAAAGSWECPVLESERKIVRDPSSGADLIFVTHNSAQDTNLYFHQRSWLPDGSMLFFFTNRTGRQEIFGYLESTGELVRLQRPEDQTISHATAGRFKNHLYFVRGKSVYEWDFEITASDSENPSKVRVTERHVGELPDNMTGSLGISENSTGRALVVAFQTEGEDNRYHIIWMNKLTGRSKEMTAMDEIITHVQASWTDPDLVMFSREHTDRPMEIPEGKIHSRMTLVDLSGRAPWPIYPQIEGELVTHECWWVEDQLTFCSGTRSEGHAEEAHVKVFDLSTGQSRIIGAGTWWPGGSPKAMSKHNWWHASGAPNGRWVAADNWHGDIAIFSARTSRMRRLTENHRTYGSGAHPHVGWNPDGTRVVFTSNRRGNPDVVIGVLPMSWRNEDW